MIGNLKYYILKLIFDQKNYPKFCIKAMELLKLNIFLSYRALTIQLEVICI